MRECWVIEEQNDNGEWYVIYAAALTDAQLMAAAPELLEACEAMFAYYAMPTDHYAPSNQALAKAWIAITKAKNLRPTEKDVTTREP